MKYIQILLVIVFLVLIASMARAQTTFNGELYAHFASPMGVTFKLFHQGTLIATNRPATIEFGELSYTASGLWLPTQMCSNTATGCYRLTVSMDPVGVVGNLDLNIQYGEVENPNARAGAPYNQRHGLGRKVAATIQTCEMYPGSNGNVECFDALNQGGGSTPHAVLLTHIQNADLHMNNTSNSYRLEFFVNSFSPNVAIWSYGSEPAEAFTNNDHSGDYEGELIITATYN